MNNSCNPSSPISSNQVTEVGLYKPRCADFQGNTLNDWLKWLADQQCKTDWTSFDTSCLVPYLSSPLDLCEQTEKTVIQAIITGVCKALEVQNQCCTGTIEVIPLNSSWTATRTAKIMKQGNVCILQGAVRASQFTDDIATLPYDKWPATDMYFPIATEFAPSNTYNVFLRIRSTGVIQLYFTGTPPVVGSTRTVYLDGVTFFTGS